MKDKCNVSIGNVQEFLREISNGELNLSTEANRNTLLNNARAKNYAKKSVEIDIKGFIPPEFIELFYTP